MAVVMTSPSSGPRRLASVAGLTRPTPGAIVLRQGDRPEHVHVVVSGVVSVHSRVDGQVVLLGFCSRGAVLGSLEAVLNTRHLASVETLGECLLQTIAVKEFHRLRSSDGEWSLYLQHVQALEIANQVRRLEGWVTASSAERLDQLMVELMALSGEEHLDGSIKLTLAVAVEKLSLLAAVRRETASRHIWRRIRAGTLLKRKGWFIVPGSSDLVARIRAERQRLHLRSGSGQWRPGGGGAEA